MVRLFHIIRRQKNSNVAYGSFSNFISWLFTLASMPVFSMICLSSTIMTMETCSTGRHISWAHPWLSAHLRYGLFIGFLHSYHPGLCRWKQEIFRGGAQVTRSISPTGAANGTAAQWVCWAHCYCCSSSCTSLISGFHPRITGPGRSRRKQISQLFARMVDVFQNPCHRSSLYVLDAFHLPIT